MMKREDERIEADVSERLSTELPDDAAQMQVDVRHGEVTLALGTAGRLVGHLFIHNSDDSPFVAERERFLQRPASRHPGDRTRR